MPVLFGKSVIMLVPIVLYTSPRKRFLQVPETTEKALILFSLRMRKQSGAKGRNSNFCKQTICVTVNVMHADQMLFNRKSICDN